MDPLAVALEVNLCGRCRFAVQVDGFILDNVALLGFKQEVRQGLGRIGGEGFGEFAQTQKIVVVSHCRTKKQKCSLELAHVDPFPGLVRLGGFGGTFLLAEAALMLPLISIW